jgi:hypothetical protein
MYVGVAVRQLIGLRGGRSIEGAREGLELVVWTRRLALLLESSIGSVPPEGEGGKGGMAHLEHLVARGGTSVQARVGM